MPDIPGGGTTSNNPTDLFSTREGYDASGHAKPAFEAEMWLYLPAVHATIGLNRRNGTDVVVDRPRPTIADVVKGVSFAFDCDCMVRYGDWSAEVTFLYVSTKEKTNVLPLPGALPAATINTNLRAIYVQPGIGYRLFRWDQVSIDVRAGITYAQLNTDAEFALGQFSRSASYSPGFVQGWAGGRIDYYPTPRWRLESTAGITGLFEQAGWNAKIAASYLVTKWFDVTIGYRASQTNQQGGLGLNGVNRNINILLRGPMASLGIRF
ncbi:MAG: hypothetical protein JO111_01930 [Caulobacteraceae bacterium]|nr:hypothetical protein [Caulobacteraceae bacterium]